MDGSHTDFGRASEPHPFRDGCFKIVFSADWLQGPGVYGGLIFAALVRTFHAALGDERALRSVQGEVLAPVKANTETELRYEVLREGRNVTYLRGDVVQGDVRASATAAFGAPRNQSFDFASATPPELPEPSTIEVLAPVPGMPAFARNHVDYRVALGGPPMAGASRAYTGGWVSLRDPGDTPRDALALALVDTWWPALFVTAEEPHHMSTMAFNAYLFDLDFDPAQPVIKTSECVVATDGYADQNDLLFTPDGRLIATSRQLVALID